MAAAAGSEETIEIKTSFLAPARPGRLVCEGHVVHKDAAVAFAQATLRDESGKPVAAATASLRCDG